MSSETTRLIKLGERRQLLGAVAGERAYSTLVRPVVEALPPTAVILLSFNGVSFVNSSFFKAIWPAIQLGEAPTPPVMVVHANDEVRSEFNIFLRSYRLPGLEARDWTNTEVSVARLHGHLEFPTREALLALLAKPGASAPELHGASKEPITPTAWTNRLNELHRLGLAFRDKRGRAWVFRATARKVLTDG